MRKMAFLAFRVVLLSSLISNSRAGEDVAGEARHSPPDTIAARAQGCATCHGNQGQGTHDNFFPRIAGKPEGYLFNQLQNFRDGRRSYPPMSYLLAYLHDDYLREIAHFFAQQKIPFDAPEKSTLPAAQLAHRGGAGEAGRQRPRHSRVCSLPWRGADGNRARHPGVDWPPEPLHHGATRGSVACRYPTRCKP